jgi:hypothetical protein
VLRIHGKGEGRPGPAAASRQAGDRPRCRRTPRGAHSAQPHRHPDGSPLRHPATTPPGRIRRDPAYQSAPAHAPAHLRDHDARCRSRPT